jgi:hypothetical protein
VSDTVAAESLLSRFPGATVEIGRAMRAMLLAKLAGIEEQPDSAANVIGYGYGPGYKGLICTLILSKSGVKLGFYKGASLPDPLSLLEGAGKVHRYVRIASVEAIHEPRLASLIEAAAEAYRHR